MLHAEEAPPSHTSPRGAAEAQHDTVRDVALYAHTSAFAASKHRPGACSAVFDAPYADGERAQRKRVAAPSFGEAARPDA